MKDGTERESMTLCQRLDRRAEKNENDYKLVLEFARAAFNGILPDAEKYVDVGYQAENEFREANVTIIHLAVSAARREIRDSLVAAQMSGDEKLG